MTLLSTPADRIIIANCSGFYGDRLSAAREMVNGGPIHVLTGDYLAELTMAILMKNKQKNPEAGYARTFLKQMEEVMGTCLDKGIRIVSNAGGLNPEGLAEKIRELASRLGLNPVIASVSGDDLMDRLDALQAQGEAFQHMDKNIPLAQAGATPITANAYLGGWGIAAALDKGADIVITGRVADAAVVAGPAAWHFKWERNDWDKLAGAYAAGHIIECGAQATGGNYAFIDEIPTYRNTGFPIAEIFEDGRFDITKHPGTGGRVSVGTVTAQLLYEVSGPRYLTPDVVVRLDTISLSQTGEDRVSASGVRGEPAPPTTKVCINVTGGYRNSMTLILTGLDIEEKAARVEDVLFESLGGKQSFEKTDIQLIRSDKSNPVTNEEAFAYLKMGVIDPDPAKVARFSSKFIELTLTTVPGFVPSNPPGKGSPVIVHWPSLVSARHIRQTVTLPGEILHIDAEGAGAGHTGSPETPIAAAPSPSAMPDPAARLIRAPLGRVFATRSGDKGGNANIGVWGATPLFALCRRHKMFSPSSFFSFFPCIPWANALDLCF
jgi:hypothetical protein